MNGKLRTVSISGMRMVLGKEHMMTPKVLLEMEQLGEEKYMMLSQMDGIGLIWENLS